MLTDAEIRRLRAHFPSTLMEATVQDPPVDASGWMRVEIDNRPGMVETCPWVARDVDPAPGDAAAVVESDGGNFWVVAWWSQTGTLPPPRTGPPLVDALPADPIDLQECDFQTAAMAAIGVRWRLVYREAAGKWDVVGASDWVVGPAGDITTASAVIVALTGGPTITVPLAGRYRVELHNALIANAAASGYAVAMVFGGGVDLEAHGLANVYVFQASSGQRIDLSCFGEVDLAAGDVLDVRVQNANSGSNRYLQAILGLRPIQVG
jgi:hypothetical protein